MNLDNHIEGDFNYYNPANQPDSIQNQPIETLEGAIDSNDPERAFEILSEVMKEVKQLRELCKQTNKDGNKDFLINRLTKIYNKL